MSRVIRPDSPSRQRAALLASVRDTLSALDTATQAQLQDRLAFIVLALRQVQASIEPTAQAWERRAYWVKADQFRRSWGWVGTQAEALLKALLAGDLAEARQQALAIEPRLAIPRPARVRDLSSMWAGCYQRLKGGGPESRG